MYRVQHLWRRRLASIGAGLLMLAVAGCAADPSPPSEPAAVVPKVVTEPVEFDSDDPAIWVNPDDPAQSLIVTTDKDANGGLFVFDLQGQVVDSVPGLARPNNVDIEYGLMLDGAPVDIAVATERYAKNIRVFALPDMTPLDGGGLEVFEGDTARVPMGIALYKRPSDGTIFAIISGKTGPTEGYLWQYRLEDDGTGQVKATKVREFGRWSGEAEIESIGVDDPLGYVYYSDETTGVHKYHADPDAPDAGRELALFATDGFAEDREGISVYKIRDGTGYILVSDQHANEFHIYTREGTPGNPHDHQLVKVVKVSTSESDGSEVTNASLNDTFPAGLFVAMSDDRTFHYYAWPDLAGDELAVAPGGVRSTEAGHTSP